MSLQPFQARLDQKQHLTEEEARLAISTLMKGRASDPEIAGLLTAWATAGVTIDELTGAARAMREVAETVRVRPGTLVDTCGTGGDGMNTFNISTVAALVVAGAGVRVAKHGNRKATSACGSADLLTALGVNVDLSPPVVSECIDELGFGFLFAPRFHLAMRHVAPVRRALGFRTIFNLLGPLTNPAPVTHQIIGIADLEMIDVMARTVQRLGIRRALIVHADDGLDEVSPVGPTQIMEVQERGFLAYTLTPESVGFVRVGLDELRGGPPDVCAGIARRILEGQPGAPRDAVVLNAACVLSVSGAAPNITSGIAMAQQAIDSGRALDLLERLKTRTNPP